MPLLALVGQHRREPPTYGRRSNWCAVGMRLRPLALAQWLLCRGLTRRLRPGLCADAAGAADMANAGQAMALLPRTQRWRHHPSSPRSRAVMRRCRRYAIPTRAFKKLACARQPAAPPRCKPAHSTQPSSAWAALQRVRVWQVALRIR